jgi:hypothetical protein
MMTRAGSGSGRLAGCVGGGEPRPRTSFRIRFGGETVEGFSIVHRLRSRNKGGRRRDAYIVSTSAGGKCNCLCRTAACDGVSRGVYWDEHCLHTCTPRQHILVIVNLVSSLLGMRAGREARLTSVVLERTARAYGHRCGMRSLGSSHKRHRNRHRDPRNLLVQYKY